MPSMRSKNICQHYFNSTIGKSTLEKSPIVSKKVADKLGNFQTTDLLHPFKSRVTSIEWHPTKQNFVAAGSKHGEMVFCHIRDNRDDSCLLEIQRTYAGSGPGGSIPSMKFHPSKEDIFFTASLCGKVVMHNLEMGTEHLCQDTMTWDFWYSALDVSRSSHLVGAGRNKGQVVLMNDDGVTVWDQRLHSQKINHIEFSNQDPNLFCTASMDRTVKLWDLRNCKPKAPLENLVHNYGVNSATFSQTDGNRLLTTDQKDELRVYNAPLWNCERTYKHPHRFFQHITSIKAVWHPLKDVILCGRYPDPVNLPQFTNYRLIDIFDVESERQFWWLRDKEADGILSLNKLNMDGTKLISAMGFNIVLWKEYAFDCLLSWREMRLQQEKHLGLMSSASKTELSGANGKSRRTKCLKARKNNKK